MKKTIRALCWYLSRIVPEKEYDVIIRGGTVYDGSGKPGVVADVAIQGDTVAAVGDLSAAVGKSEVDAKGMAVAPGFINMLSHAYETLRLDGNGQSDIRRGITLRSLEKFLRAPSMMLSRKRCVPI